jgi:hypothetical protein
MLYARDFEGGYRITAVRDGKGNPLRHTIVKTMMRVDLPAPLAPGQSTSFSVDWNYNINDQRKIGGRTGYEFFPKDGNYLYEIAHWFPRMAALQRRVRLAAQTILRRGRVHFRVRQLSRLDHRAQRSHRRLDGRAAKPESSLTPQQRQRLEQAKTAKEPVLIVTPAEALANEANKPTGKKTWVFHADNVRDFAFASSRKFIWDAQGHNVEGNRVMAMSYYPKEGNPLWERYSTHSIIHTLNVYSRYSFTYPYPIAISVNGPVGGMEYPMICFNGPRPEEDGTYTASTKYGLISVIIHEVGHNYFPMIVNSDERQWTWMDEGLNTFCNI